MNVRYQNHDDDDGTPEVIVRLPKSYFFAGGGLLVHHWASDGIEERYDRMTRVSDPSLSPAPLGSWVQEWLDDNTGELEIFTMTLDADGTFTWSEEFHYGTWTLAAKWQLDLDNYFINLTNVIETWTEPGSEPEPTDRTREARFVRFAYAPMPAESGERMIRVSDWGAELDEPEGEHGETGAN